MDLLSALLMLFGQPSATDAAMAPGAPILQPDGGGIPTTPPPHTPPDPQR